jgi:phospholipase C
MWAGGGVTDNVLHAMIITQENRSCDEYLGTLNGARTFSSLLSLCTILGSSAATGSVCPVPRRPIRLWAPLK